MRMLRWILSLTLRDKKEKMMISVAYSEYRHHGQGTGGQVEMV